MLFLTLLVLFLQFQGLACQDANGITLDEKVLAVERLLLSGGTIIFPVTPCYFILNGPPQPSSTTMMGDQTSAQWVRTVFHDFITANVTAGTGGLDASVSFEADRPENLGLVLNSGPFGPQISFINATILGFNLFSNVFISTSDFIALGLAASLLSCDPDGRFIQLKVGRTDATKAGPSGVPQASDSATVAQTAFANAGFSQSEMIQAVACGHSLGGVHKVNFPQIVGTEPTVGTEGRVEFDSTPAIFDNVGVNEYLNGSGQAGGPLVTTANKTFQSDLRIFTSDHNLTIKAMASPQAFEDTCFTIFEKMINTVPSGTVLSDPIGPRPWITMESHLDLSPTGAVQYSGTIATHSWNGFPPTASYYYGTVGGGNTGPKTSEAGVVQSNIVNAEINAIAVPFGTVIFYAFNDTMNSPEITSINIQGSYTEPINLNLFVLPSQSFVDSTTGQFIVRAALLTTLSPQGTTLTGTLYFPAVQPNSVAPRYTQATSTLTSYKTIGPYTIFQGVITRPAIPLTEGSSHIDVQLGSQRSPKVPVNAPSTIPSGAPFFNPCTNNPLTTC